MSWNKNSRAQKEQFDWPMPLNFATQVPCNFARRVAESRTDLILLFATIAATKKLRQMSVAGYVTLRNISCNLCRNKIVREVAREIA